METETNFEELFKDKFSNSQNIGVKVLINSIFHKNEKGYFTCLIKEEQYLVNLFYHLLECENNEVIEMLEFLSFILKKFSQNSEIFRKVSSENKKENSFLSILIKKYFITNCQEIMKIVMDLIEFLLNHVEFDKSNMEYVFQEIAVCFRHEKTILDENLLKKFMGILKLLCGEKLSYLKPKNFIYLSGSSSIKVNEKLLDQDRIKLSNGCVISFWFNIAQYPTQMTQNISNLINLKSNKSLQIELSLHQNKLLFKSLPKFEYDLPEGWNFLSISIKPKNFFRDPEIIFIINDHILIYKLPDLECDCDIKELVFFDNFIGQVSSIILLNKYVGEEITTQLKEFKFGFNSEKRLFKLLKHCNNNYMNNSNFRYKFQFQKDLVGFSNVIDNLKILFTPSRFNENVLFDVIGKYNATIVCKSGFQNSVKQYYCYQKNIFYLGGIKNFLPLFELIFTKNLFTENIFLNYLELIQIIFNFKSKNIKNCTDASFFKLLSIFVEKLPMSLFSKLIMLKFLEIGKFYLSYNEENEVVNEYFEYILFNENIITKFHYLVQVDFWRNINELCYNYLNEIKRHLRVKKIIILLRFYDNNKYNEICCDEHNSLINQKNKNEISHPNIKMKIECIINILRFLICDNEDDKNENFRFIISFLTLDNSMCIQKGIISIFDCYIKSNKKEEIKYKTLINLIENKMLEVILYVYSFSTIDIKCIFINIFKEISNILRNDETNFKLFFEKIIIFLNDHLLVDKLLFYNTIDRLDIDKVTLSEKFHSDKNIVVLSKKILKNNYETTKLSLSLDNEEINKNEENVKTEIEITKTGKSIIREIDEIEIINQYKSQKNKDIAIEKEKSIEEIYFIELKRTYNIDVYNSYINEMYMNLFLWLLNANQTSNEYSLPLFDDNDFIVNHYVINIMINSMNFINVIFVQRFFQDIHLLIMNNSQNCLFLYKNELFYLFLIEISYKYYLMMNNESDELNGSAITIYNLGKKIHSELFLNLILKDGSKKSTPIKKINYLLDWSLKFKKKSKNYELNCFIKSLLIDLLVLLVDLAKSIPPNINSVIWENLTYFSILIYEFMTFHNLLNYLVRDYLMLKDINVDNVIVPQIIISSLNLERETPNNNISPSNKKMNSLFANKVFDSKSHKTKELWNDFIIFQIMYSSYSDLWSKKFYEADKGLKYDENRIVIYEKIIEEFIINKKQKDLFIEIIKIFFHNFKIDDKMPYNNNLIKVISNTFVITISLVQETSEIIYWLEEYERFLLFFLIVSCNMKNNKNDFYNIVQDTIADIINFAICFLSDEYKHSRKNSINKKYFFCGIKNLLTFLIIIYETIFTKSSKKKNIGEIQNPIVKIAKNYTDLNNSACYKIFSYLVLNEKNEEIVKLPIINQLKSKDSDKIFDELFLNEYWVLAVFDNNKLRKRFKLLFDFNAYSEIMNHRINFQKFYKPIISEDKLDISNLNPTKFLSYNMISPIASNLELEFKKYHNYMFNNVKNKRFQYKNLKKKLFQWTGMWTDKKVYYNENNKLKFKISNHLTSYFSKPILVPILDYIYYLPSFTKFEHNNLFLCNKNNLKYSISLDIDKIVNKYNKSNDDNEENVLKFKQNHNFLFKIYKNNENKLNAIYDNISKIEEENKENHKQYELFAKIKLSNDPKFLKYENVFDCCYVKLSHHIRGYFQITSDGIYLRPFKAQFQKPEEGLDEFLLNLEDYDVDRQTCYGSVLSFHHKEKDISFFFWPIHEIKMIVKKRYYFKKKAFEVFTISNKSYFFSFKNQQIRDAAISLLISFLELKREIRLDTKESKDKSDLIIGYEQLNKSNLSTNALSLSQIVENWTKWKISNFEMLMWLNLLGNRSYNDISQYPIFPWIIKNYITEELNLSTDLRQLNCPMGMLETDNRRSIERKKKYLEEYKESGLYSEKHRHYGSHYSNPLYVSHYLTRLFPYVQIHIELQGDKFDDPNRLFFSIFNSFKSATTQQGDIRELTPEFFFLPEIFININNLNMGKRNNEMKALIQVNDVEIPPWAGSDPYHFVCDKKRTLESDIISSKINEWIDLIFGLKQSGKDAELAGNVFDYISYENSIDLEKEDKNKRCFFMRTAEFGLTPTQLFYKPFPIRQLKEKAVKGYQVFDCKELKIYRNSQKIKKENIPIMIYMQYLDTEKLMCIYNNNTFNLYKFQLSDNKFNITVENKTYFSNDIFSKVCFKINYYNENSYNSPCVIFNSGKAIVQGGYYDGRISLSYSEGEMSKCFNYYSELYFPITALAVDKKEQFIFAGNKIGCVFVYKIFNLHLKLHKIIYDHSNEITYISCSDTLNVIATASIDGLANLYTYPQIKLFRSISNELLPINYIFLSSYPLPSFVIYSPKITSFRAYSINGKILFNQEEDCKYLLSPQIFTSISYDDFLIYGTINSELKIRKLPSLILIKSVSLSERLTKTESLNSLKCIDLSKDKKVIFIWKTNDIDVTIVKEPAVFSDK